MKASEALSPWWKNTLILTMIIGFTVLIWVSTKAYKDAPPIPQQVINTRGETIFTKDDIQKGQQVFLKYGLMENGTIWGHGAYLGPDFSAEYLHTLAAYIGDPNKARRLLKQNRYDPKSNTLTFTESEERSYKEQITKWRNYFSNPRANYGLPAKYINSPKELKQLTAFFAWCSWASVVNRPGKNYTYTNNFPFDPSVGNMPSADALLWSALSLVALLGGIGFVLFLFGKFDYLGWKNGKEYLQPQMFPGAATKSQEGTIKYFVIIAVLFLLQSLAGGATAHYRADPTGFFGIDLSSILPSNIVRTWHLQLAIFWIATAYIAGGLFLAPAVGGKEPKGQVFGVNFLFLALLIVVLGSLSGEILGINNMLGKLWFWFGHQGWEYLDLGRAWQILLAVGLVIWIILLFRGILPATKNPETKEISSLFLYSAVAIPLFYLPAFFFNSTSHLTVVDTWRFWIIHLWVEGFFELFVTVMVAIIFYKLGIVSNKTATRVVYLDAILYLGSGIIGTGHHWYWTGQSNITMALGAVFSALEVVPLTLLTLDAWDFIKLEKGEKNISGINTFITHKWTFYFLMAVGFWNFLGAGVFGFLINLPIVSYFEVGTLLTPNHGHAAMMGVFGMLAIALMVFALRQVLNDENWKKIEKYISVSFWGLNIGLILMVVTNLFPGGVMQLIDVLNNGYSHARSPEFLNQSFMRTIEWIRLPADFIFIVFGCIPLVIASSLTYMYIKRSSSVKQPQEGLF